MVDWKDMGHAVVLSLSAVLGVVGANYVTTYITTGWQQAVAGAVIFLAPLTVIHGSDGAAGYIRLFLMTMGVTTLIRGLAQQFNITQLASATYGVL